MTKTNESGYRPCACRDCFEIAIGEPGAFCHACEDAGCNGDGECDAPGAYNGDGCDGDGSRIAELCRDDGAYPIATLSDGPAAVLARLLDALRQLAPEAVAGLPGISPDALADDAHPAWNGGPAEAALHAIMATVNAHAPEGFALIIEGDSLGFHPLAGEGI